MNQNCGIIQEDRQHDSMGMCDAASVVLCDKNSGASLDTEIKPC